MQWQRSFRPTEYAWPRTRACSRGRFKGQGDTHLLSSVGSPGRNTYMREVLGKPKAQRSSQSRQIHVTSSTFAPGIATVVVTGGSFTGMSTARLQSRREGNFTHTFRPLSMWGRATQPKNDSSIGINPFNVASKIAKCCFFWRKITVDGFGVCENSSLPRCSGKSWLRACCQEGTAWYKLRLGGEISQHGN